MFGLCSIQYVFAMFPMLPVVYVEGGFAQVRHVHSPVTLPMCHPRDIYRQAEYNSHVVREGSCYCLRSLLCPFEVFSDVEPVNARCAFGCLVREYLVR
jgi:hypothetical protein